MIWIWMFNFENKTVAACRAYVVNKSAFNNPYLWDYCPGLLHTSGDSSTNYQPAIDLIPSIIILMKVMKALMWFTNVNKYFVIGLIAKSTR